jgi:HSP20 family molecular chaperone IbpA
MNTETLINATDKEVQPKSIDLAAAVNKDAERAKCGNGVCEVAWKPFTKSEQLTAKQAGA